jgi:hypothetical protein
MELIARVQDRLYSAVHCQKQNGLSKEVKYAYEITVTAKQ